MTATAMKVATSVARNAQAGGPGDDNPDLRWEFQATFW
jgi:hypothetical protein